MNDRQSKKLSNFLNEKGQLKSMPAKYSVQLLVLEYLHNKFEEGRDYTEKEINDIVRHWLQLETYDDYATLRRDMVDSGLLAREADCSRYWKVKREI